MTYQQYMLLWLKPNIKVLKDFFRGKDGGGGIKIRSWFNGHNYYYCVQKCKQMKIFTYFVDFHQKRTTS